MKEQIEQTPVMSLDAVYKLMKDLEGTFVQMGQVLSHIKAKKLYAFKGYESFRDFVEQEHHLKVKSANKLIRVYRCFVGDLDMDEEVLKDIGMDRLGMIVSLVEKADWEERDELVGLAGNLSVPELAAELKKRKAEAAPETPTDLKKVLVDQWKEWFTGAFNASWGEVQFKLALWFSAPTKCDPAFLKAMKDDIRVLQARFEEEAGNADR